LDMSTVQVLTEALQVCASHIVQWICHVPHLNGPCLTPIFTEAMQVRVSHVSTWDMTHSYAWYELFIVPQWITNIPHINESCPSMIRLCVISLIYMWNTTPSYVGHNCHVR